jgi:hypothetical protein
LAPIYWADFCSTAKHLVGDQNSFAETRSINPVIPIIEWMAGAWDGAVRPLGAGCLVAIQSIAAIGADRAG